MNCARLEGEFFRSDALRYTPSGVPILEFRLIHSSTQEEGGTARRVELEMEVLAVSGVAEALAKIGNGSRIKLEGFLAKKGAKSREIVLHATHFELTG